MTDAITDAVRRIKRLQEDVERLKAAQSDEGQPRLFVREEDTAAADDIQRALASEAVGGERALAWLIGTYTEAFYPDIPRFADEYDVEPGGTFAFSKPLDPESMPFDKPLLNGGLVTPGDVYDVEPGETFTFSKALDPDTATAFDKPLQNAGTVRPNDA